MAHEICHNLVLIAEVRTILLGEERIRVDAENALDTARRAKILHHRRHSATLVNCEGVILTSVVFADEDEGLDPVGPSLFQLCWHLCYLCETQGF